MALTRLRLCAGWSEPLLVAHSTLLEISCHGSFKDAIPASTESDFLEADLLLGLLLFGCCSRSLAFSLLSSLLFSRSRLFCLSSSAGGRELTSLPYKISAVEYGTVGVLDEL